MSSTGIKTVLISRTDSLAGLLLSIPVLKTIKKRFPKRRIVLLGEINAIQVFDKEPYIDFILGFDNLSKNINDNLVSKIISLNCEQALLLNYDKQVVNLLKKSKIRQIMGPANSFSSMFSLNAWKKQNRLKANKHEIEYNLELLDLLGIEPKFFEKESKITVSEFIKTKLFENINLEKNKYVIINPISDITKLNWRYSFYGELALRVIEDLNLDVFFISNIENKRIVDLLIEQTSNKAKKIDSLDLKMLSAFISEASVFVSPNSSFLHLAAAVGVPVLAVFSEIKKESSNRWAPYTDNSKILSSQVRCPEKEECKEDKCPNYLCMDKISIDDVCNGVVFLLNQTERPKDLGF